MKYKLKLHYTSDELKELKILSKNFNSPMHAIRQIADIGNGSNKLKNLQIKYCTLGYEDEFDFMDDINNAVMGTAIFPEELYVVHDKVTDQYIYYSMTQRCKRWGQLEAEIPEKKTKEEWLAINPAYEPMLERVDHWIGAEK